MNDKQQWLLIAAVAGGLGWLTGSVVVGIAVFGVGFGLRRWRARGDRAYGQLMSRLGVDASALPASRHAGLAAALAAQRGKPGIEREAMQTYEQYQSLQSRMHAFLDVLERKFGTGELTYGRFRGALDALYWNLMTQLAQAGDLLNVVGSADTDLLEAQVRQARLEDPDSQGATSALEERLQLTQDRRAQLRQLLVENERALTRMMSLSAELASIETDSGGRQLSFDGAVAQIEELAGRVAQYDVHAIEKMGH